MSFLLKIDVKIHDEKTCDQILTMDRGRHVVIEGRTSQIVLRLKIDNYQ